MIDDGVDGTPGSDTALRWALDEARLRGVSVRALHVYRSPTVLPDGAAMGAPGIFAAAASSEEVQRLHSVFEAQAERVLDDALAREDAQAAGVEVEAEAVEGQPAETLIRAGRDAELLVIGSRGHGGFVGLLLGSVSQQCAQHPPCPVVILPAVESE
jgi:nucleotide-binding universal stress UspA family protein